MTDAEFLRELAWGPHITADVHMRLREIAGKLAQVPPREPTEAMIRAAIMIQADAAARMGIVDWSILWRAMYDAAQPPSAPAEGKP